MSDSFCLPKTHLLIILCVFLGFTVFYVQFNNYKKIDYIQPVQPTQPIQQIQPVQTIQPTQQIQPIQPTQQPVQTVYQPVQQTQPVYQTQPVQQIQPVYQTQPVQPQYIIIKNDDTSFLEKRRALEYRDEQVKYNDFKPPERRIPEYAYPNRGLKQLLNIPTRGYPDNYQMLGLLLRENTETVYNLFGRQTYPGSNQYEYYAQGNMHYNNVKLPIYSKGNRELNDGDEVRIPGTDESKGKFKVKLYNLDAPRYNPYEI